MSGLPPEMAAMMGPAAAGPEAMDAQTAGAEAVAQSDIAKNGLAAWKRCQALNGARCSGDDLKAMIMYVLTEGPSAPEAAAMSAYLQDHGVNLPGVGTGGMAN